MTQGGSKAPPPAQVGDIVKGARDRLKLTQRQLAEQVGVSPGFIAKVEGNESLPGYGVCVALTQVLGLALDDLWAMVRAARSDNDERRRQRRVDAVQGAVRTRGAVHVRRMTAVTGRAPRGPAEIGQEIADDADLLTAYKHLRTAMTDPSLRTTVMTTLEALARMVESKDQPRRR
jgi:transcriptional regulator with XRE-family HTH domain